MDNETDKTVAHLLMLNKQFMVKVQWHPESSIMKDKDTYKLVYKF